MYKNLNLILPTIRNTLKLDISQALSFNNILKKTDLPYNFSIKKNYWWRWYSEIFGFYYNSIKRTYCIWITTFLKKNLDVKMPFFFSILNKNIKPLNKYKNYIFLFNNSLNNISNFKFQSNKFKIWKFEKTNVNTLSEASKFILFPQNRQHRIIGSFGILDGELDMFYSSYNSNWNNLYNKNSIFTGLTIMSKNFYIIINNYMYNTSFFINSFDSHLNIYPQNYLDFLKKQKINKMINNIFAKFFFFYKNLNYYNKLIINLINNFFSFLTHNLVKFGNIKLLNLIKKYKYIKRYLEVNYNKFNFINLNFPKSTKKFRFVMFLNVNIKNFKNIYFKNLNLHKYQKFYIIKLIKYLINNNNNVKKNVNFFKNIYIKNIINNNFKKLLWNKFIKILNKNYNNVNTFINIVKKKLSINLINKIKWVTKFKKYIKKTYMNNFISYNQNYINLKSVSKLLWFFLYEEKFVSNLKILTSKLIYNVLSICKNNLIVKNFNNHFNINYYILFNYMNIINYFIMSRKNLNLLDIKFCYFLKMLNLTIKNVNSRNNYKLTLKNINYIKFI